MQYQLITSQTALEDYLADIDRSHVLAIDTEFFRETSYYPALGLVQLAYDNRIACVDPLAFDASDTLANVLLDKTISKLFHSCSQDLEVLLQTLGELPCPVVDTQLAAALVTDRDQISYADIVARYCGVELEKSQTRTNWLKRPLSEKQLVYAAEDVHYLPEVYHLLLDELDDQDRRQWFEQDCAKLCESADRFEPDMERVWTRVKGTQKLSREQLAIVDALARWREQHAIRLDATRKMVVSDDAIVAAAIRRPSDITQLTAEGRWHRKLQPADLSSALEQISQRLDTDPDSWPQHLRLRQSAEQKTRIREMMSMVEQAANDLGIAQSVLGSRKEIEKLLAGGRDLNILSGWRAGIIGDRLLASVSA